MRGSVIKYIFLISLLVLSAAFFLYYTRLANQGELLVTRLDSIREIKFIGKSGEILQILLTGALISLINFGLAFVLTDRNKFASLLLPVSTALFNLLLLIYVWFIVSIN